MNFKEFLRVRLHRDLGDESYIVDGAPFAHMNIIGREKGMLYGMFAVPLIVELVVNEFFSSASPYRFPPHFVLRKQEGDAIDPGDVLVELYGNGEILLKSERVICDIVGELSGIATHVRRRVEEVAGTGVYLSDTRKDNSLMRSARQQAVVIGGGRKHRYNLTDGILVKKTDIAVYGGICQAIDRRLKEVRQLTKIEIEVETLDALDEVLNDGRVDAILLDNMNLDVLREAMKRIRASNKKYLIEASGVGSLSLRDVALTGVDCISLSSLTCGVKPLNVSAVVVAHNE
ncbi:MAG: hypothetical protein A2939_00590 [Parcubacteria group bacterium RIFCSPLOWO2_01_FULL_48_18]|nr:MAG: hypothetical protein A2939_00590 [Parcubacteria group bacterium RIFCSPLOWO2_01_FULL_48_18]OHB23202.1 MAG: hypothetical protein A3J67_00395 [Parcubacteria group bacterium RIFCSPHIGHO2_02_FULL_48_10b]